MVNETMVSKIMDEPKLTLSKRIMQKSSKTQKATFSYNLIKKTLLRVAIGMSLMTPLAYADQILSDNYIVQGSLCVGLDCVNGENFNFDTIRLKENNTRIRFVDSSSSGGFPTNDWQLTANDSANGGVNKFSIEDIDSSKVPFTITAGAPTNSIFVKANGYVGFNTGSPLMQLHVKHGNSPALRLEQDGSSGFAAQSWDITGNETNFFIRDASNSSKIPFKIVPNAPTNSLYVAADGDIGFETSTPDGQFDIAHYSDANNHAVLVSPVSNFGINIDNGFLPRGLLDVQTTGGKSRFYVGTDGKVGIGLSTSDVPAGFFEVKDNAGSSKFIVDNEGDIGIGTSAPAGRFEVTSIDGASKYLAVDAAGNVGVGTNTPTNILHVESAADTALIKSTEEPGTADYKTLLTLNSAYGNNLLFQNRSKPDRNWAIGTSAVGDAFLISRADTNVTGDLGDKWNLLINDTYVGIRDANANTMFELVPSGLTINGTFVSASSRTFKENIQSVDNKSVLDTLMNLDIALWNYLSDDEKALHMGPIAEEFFEAFGLGASDKHITTTDVSGVALASIKALNTELMDKASKIEQLEKQNSQLTNKINEIESKLNQVLKNQEGI